MRNRLLIVVAGVLIGLALKWGFGGSSGSAEEEDKSRPKPATQQPEPKPGGDRVTRDDTLVPPAIIGFDSPQVAHADHSQSSRILAVSDPEFSHGERAGFEPHGEQVCASGCAASRHPTKELPAFEYDLLIEQFAGEPINDQSDAFETLLYFGRQTREFMRRRGTGSLDEERVAALQRELVRTHAKITIRVVDEDGQVRSWLPPTLVPLDRRHVFSMSVEDVQPLVTSGTVKRVGFDRVWTRL